MRRTALREDEAVGHASLGTAEHAPEDELMELHVAARELADVLRDGFKLRAIHAHRHGAAGVAPYSRHRAQHEHVAVCLRSEDDAIIAAHLDMGYGIPS